MLFNSLTMSARAVERAAGVRVPLWLPSRGIGSTVDPAAWSLQPLPCNWTSQFSGNYQPSSPLSNRRLGVLTAEGPTALSSLHHPWLQTSARYRNHGSSPTQPATGRVLGIY